MKYLPDTPESLEYYRKYPGQVRYGRRVTYAQALAAVESDASMYSYLDKDIKNRDSQNNYKLLRAAMSENPGNLWRVHQPKNVPVDLLLLGLQDVGIWEKVLDNWIVYDNKEFHRHQPEVCELIKMYKSLGLSPSNCVEGFLAWQNRHSQTEHTTSVSLPFFD